MTRDDIICMAHESSLDVYGLGKDYAKFADALERFAALVAASERGACANMCDDLADEHEKRDQWNSHKTADVLAQAIRARSKA